MDKDGTPKLPHGRIEEPVLAEVAQKFAKHQRQLKYSPKARWYSRVYMWLEASKLGLSSVDDLSDTQFDKVLDVAHDKLQSQGPARESSDLLPNMGPLDHTERRGQRAHYVSMPRRFQYYSFRIVQSQLGCSLADATERQVEESLRRTNAELKNTAVARGVPEQFLYRGPQCYSQNG